MGHRRLRGGCPARALKGTIVAIVVSLVALLHQVANPPVYVLGRKPGTDAFRPRSKEHPGDETFPGLLLLRLEGRVFFFNAEHIGQKMRLLIDEAKPKIVAIDLSGVYDLEYTALKMLIEGERSIAPMVSCCGWQDSTRKCWQR